MVPGGSENGKAENANDDQISNSPRMGERFHRTLHDPHLGQFNIESLKSKHRCNDSGGYRLPCYISGIAG